MYWPAHVNVGADECSSAVLDEDMTLIWHKGRGYTVVGFYFAHGQNGERDLWLVLRLVDGNSTAEHLSVSDTGAPAGASAFSADHVRSVVSRSRGNGDAVVPAGQGGEVERK